MPGWAENPGHADGPADGTSEGALFQPNLAPRCEVSSDGAITLSDLLYVARHSKFLKPIVYSTPFNESAGGEVHIQQRCGMALAKVLQSGFQRGKFSGRKCGTY